MNKNFKTFQTFANKCKKSTLSILNGMKVENGVATFFDLENEVCFPVDLENGFYDLIRNKPYRIGDLNDDYPDFGELEETGIEITINNQDLIVYAPFVAKDDLRPIMEGILIRDNNIVSCDAHVMLHKELGIQNFPDEFEVLIKPDLPILSRCKADKTGTFTLKMMKEKSEGEKEYIRLEFNDCTITQPMIQGRYPDWKTVVPDWNSKSLTCLELSSTTATEIKEVARNFSTKKTVMSKDGSLSIANEDLGLKETFQATPASQPKTKPCGLIMPVMIKIADGSEELAAFNPEKLVKFAQQKGQITIGVFDPDRAMAVWLQPEQQKAPARKPVAAKPETRNSKPVTRNANPIPHTTQQWYFCRKTNQYLQA